jgi:Holliday junction DNA helicase RuvA
MIVSLRGQLVRSLPTLAEVEVAGVGYEMSIPVSTFDKLPPPPAEVRLLTHLHIREDAHQLFGFATEEERCLFRLLIQNVSGVGPKLALAVLSGLSVSQFQTAVVNGDVPGLARVKGLGKKTAEKIIVELRDKVGGLGAWGESTSAPAAGSNDRLIADAVLALITLGYKNAEATQAARMALAAHPDLTTENLIRDALRILS